MMQATGTRQEKDCRSDLVGVNAVPELQSTENEVMKEEERFLTSRTPFGMTIRMTLGCLLVLSPFSVPLLTLWQIHFFPERLYAAAHTSL